MHSTRDVEHTTPRAQNKDSHSILIPGESRQMTGHYSEGTGDAEAKKVIPISGRAETDIKSNICRWDEEDEGTTTPIIGGVLGELGGCVWRPREAGR